MATEPRWAQRRNNRWRHFRLFGNLGGCISVLSQISELPTTTLEVREMALVLETDLINLRKALGKTGAEFPPKEEDNGFD